MRNMQRINIPLGGMSNVPDDNYSQDGDMQVLVNMRSEAGELVPMAGPSVKTRANEVIEAKYHAQSGMWLELRNEGVDLIAIKDDGAESAIGQFDEDRVEHFELMGNIVILYKSNSIEYAIWRNGQYVLLGELPEPPRLKASIENIVKTVGTGEEYYINLQEAKENNSEDLYNRYVMKGFLDRCLNALYSDGCYIDRVLFCVGLRLFDGSYIYSNVYYVSNHDYMTTEVNVAEWGWRNFMWKKTSNASAGKSTFIAEILGFKPIVSLSEFDLTKWENIIISVDLFSTNSIMSHKAEKVVEEGKREQNEGSVLSREYETYVEKSAVEIRDEVGNADLFYRVKEFDLVGKLISEIENTSPSELSVKEQAPAWNAHQLRGEKVSVYNARLHAMGVKRFLYNGFFDFKLIDTEHYGESEWTTPEVVFAVDVITDNGTNTVVRTLRNVTSFHQASGVAYLSPYLTYPDARAVGMKIWMRRRVTGEDSTVHQYEYRFKKFPLVRHKTMDVAFYLNRPDSSFENRYKEGIDVINVADWDKLTEEQYNQDIGNLQSNNIEEQPNVLRVSAVDNPFYYPAAQTYKFDGEIVGGASNAEAVSTGQFGQYPLFVFTKNGIWAMSVDGSGQGAYTSMAPFSREVCSGAICPVSGGVVFATDRGVMAISGGQVSELSEVMDGGGVKMYDFSELYSRIMGKADVEWDIKPGGIREYLEKNTVIAYNYHHNEILISTPGKSFSFVYGLRSQRWSVTDVVFELTTNHYPGLVVYNGKDMLVFDDAALPVAVCGISRPIKLGAVGYKRIRQAALRGTFEGKLGLYILGSDDGVNFEGVTGKEHDGATRRDMITPMARSKMYRFFAVAFAGKVEGRLSLVELLADGAVTNNRLR